MCAFKEISPDAFNDWSLKYKQARWGEGVLGFFRGGFRGVFWGVFSRVLLEGGIVIGVY